RPFSSRRSCSNRGSSRRVSQPRRRAPERRRRLRRATARSLVSSGRSTHRRASRLASGPSRITFIRSATRRQLAMCAASQPSARAWSDPGYRARLLADPWAAIAELGVTAIPDAPLVVVENGPTIHNVVVCTLCSCYPSGLLGLPPSWYKSPAYRARMVREPRAVLAEMGLVLPADVEVRVWDSSAEMRYMVLPERPAGTDAMSQDDLAALVTRDAMIGVA